LSDPLDAPLIELKDVRFGYGERAVLDGLSLSVPRGQILAVMGGSGNGKTSLLGLLGGRYAAWSGSVQVDGQEVGRLSGARLYALRRRMGMLFQFGALFTDLSVFDNVAFPYREQTSLPESVIRDLVLMKLEAVGLRGAAGSTPSHWSGGMARRVALARAIALDPMLMMYDEPFTGLDPISAGIIGRLIQRLNAAFGMTSLIVTHDVNETLRIADRIVLISEGRIVRDMTPQELRDSDDLFIRQFADGLPDGPVPFHYPAAPYALQLLGEGDAHA
jgi:phospholipid/cholesterol/gamma-HCH transport system ATP-binding protein